MRFAPFPPPPFRMHYLWHLPNSDTREGRWFINCHTTLSEESSNINCRASVERKLFLASLGFLRYDSLCIHCLSIHQSCVRVAVENISESEVTVVRVCFLTGIYRSTLQLLWFVEVFCSARRSQRCGRSCGFARTIHLDISELLLHGHMVEISQSGFSFPFDLMASDQNGGHDNHI
jgi:hypothetical protein